MRKKFVGFCPKMAVMTWILSCEKIHKLSYSLFVFHYFTNVTSFNTDKLVCICVWSHVHFEMENMAVQKEHCNVQEVGAVRIYQVA